MKTNKRKMTLAGRQISLGASASEVVTALPEIIPALRILTFKTYTPGLGVSERLRGPQIDEPASDFVKSDELGENQMTHWRYWDAIVEDLCQAKDITSLLKKLLQHDPEEELRTRICVSSTVVKAGWIEQKVSDLPQGAVLALCSLCELEDGVTAHIPMMDFNCGPSRRNLALTQGALRELGQRDGVLLESGRSYHYYGFEPLLEKDWINFVAGCLLLSPLTDSRYIAHRLMAGACVLRITASERKPQTPYVVQTIGG